MRSVTPSVIDMTMTSFQVGRENFCKMADDLNVATMEFAEPEEILQAAERIKLQ